MRGNDINYNPVFFAYLIFFPTPSPKAKLFIQASKLSDPSVKAHLQVNNVEVYDYTEITAELKVLKDSGAKIAFDENSCNALLYEVIKGDNTVHVDNVVQHIKAHKNPVEMEGMRNVNIKNCASLIQYFAWMEEHLRTNP